MIAVFIVDKDCTCVPTEMFFKGQTMNIAKWRQRKVPLRRTVTRKRRRRRGKKASRRRQRRR